MKNRILQLRNEDLIAYEQALWSGKDLYVVNIIGVLYATFALLRKESLEKDYSCTGSEPMNSAAIPVQIQSKFMIAK